MVDLGYRTASKDRSSKHWEFTNAEMFQIGIYNSPKMKEVRARLGEGHQENKETTQLMKDWENYQEHGTRYMPETDLTRRKAFMSRRYTSSPAGGFSGALGGAAVQKKKLLGA